MAFQESYKSGQFGLSFELFPPKTERGEAALFRHVARLAEFKPCCITCTYGAGGSTQSKTLDIIGQVHRDFQLPVASHLTCVGRSADQIREYLQQAIKLGVENIVALRGDPPQGETSFQAVEGGFSYANELVAMIQAEFPSMGIAVAGYPEKHQEAPSLEVDIENLKRKVDSGANVVFTQLFYDNEDYYRFRDQCNAAGIHVPIVPGLLPVVNFAQIQRITTLCGAKLPVEFVKQLESAGDDVAAQFEIGVAQASKQTEELLNSGVPGIHYYVLNKSDATAQVLQNVTLP